MKGLLDAAKDPSLRSTDLLRHLPDAPLSRRNMNDLLQAIVDSAALILDAPCCELMLKEGEELVVWAFTPNQLFLRGDRVRRHEALLSWQAHDSCQPAVVDDYSTWSGRRAVYNSLPLRAVADFPIIVEQSCLGVLGLGRLKPDHHFEPHELQIGMLFAQLAGLVLNNAKLHQAAQYEINERKQAEALLQHRLRFIEIIQQITTDFIRVEVGQIDDQIVVVLREVAMLFAVERGYVFLIAHERGFVELTHEWCAPGVVPHRGVLDAVSMVEFADYLDTLRQGQIARVQTRDVLHSPANQALLDVLHRLGILSFVNVPLFISEQLIGWIGFDAVLQENEWPQETIEAFQLTGQLIATAIYRKRTTEALYLSELQFHSLFNHMSEGVALHRLIYNEQGQPINYEIVDVNPQYERILNLRREDVCHRLANQVYGTEEPPYLAEFAAVGSSGQPTQFETYFAPVQKHFSISVSPLAPNHFATIFFDITARKQAEVEQAHLQAQLLQAQKMEAIGYLAGGIAHDFNNILTVISGNADLALSVLSPEHPACEDVQSIQQSVVRATHLVRQLLTFARRQVHQPEVVDLNAMVLGITPMLRRLIGEHISLVVLPNPALDRVKIDPHQFEQVLINLVVNARDAMPSGGMLTITTANRLLTATDTHRSTGSAPGSYVSLTVSDTGIGMTDVVKNHIFEPYFTTKEVGHGTGLGLATCLGIVSQHHGFMWVESTPGQGSRFTVYLPITTEQPPSLEQTKPNTELKRGTETVLVVEDEPEVRQLAVRILRTHGYTVFEATNGQEAQWLAEALAEQPIDLLLTDMVMPGTGGLDLARQLKAKRPALKVILMSGYADQLHIHQDLLAGNIVFLQKPFSRTTLLEQVRRTLQHG